jgi:two-component system, NarL family, response regulator
MIQVMPGDSIIRIAVIDDHPLIREGLIALLSTQPDIKVVADASDGADALNLYRTHRPDVLLMDLSMPKLGGVEATAAICKEFSNARILVLTIRTGDEDIHRALRAGAKGYLLKETSSRELFDAIRSVHDGRRYIPPSVAMQLAERPPASELTQRELEILQKIVYGKSNKEIADVLSITEATVKGHVSNILIKLGAGDRTEAVTTALRRGIVHLK